LEKETDMNKPRAKRILGMNGPQWLVLGILLLCLCVTLVGGYWWLNSRVASAYTGPQQQLLDITPLPTRTALPTATLQPTATITPITYESLIPAGWKRFRLETGSNIEIWLPESYSRQSDKDQQKAIQILGGGEEDKSIETLLLLKDNTPSNYMIITTFEMARRTGSVSDLDAMIDQQFSALMREGRLLERGKFEFKVEGYPARRLIFDINSGSVNAGIALYVVQVGKDVYFLSYATIFNELYVRLPAIDESIQTFRVTPIIPTKTPSPTVPAPTNTSLP
jgi:hypothetical protein